MNDRNIMLSLPAIYAQDREDRDLSMGDVLRRGERMWRVAVDTDTLKDMISDAEYYAKDVDDCAASLVQSAKVAVKALRSAKR